MEIPRISGCFDARSRRDTHPHKTTHSHATPHSLIGSAHFCCVWSILFYQVGLSDRIRATPAAAEIGSALTDSLSGTGRERWLKTSATDANAMVKLEHQYKAVDAVEPYTNALEVTNVSAGAPVGVVFPLKSGVDIARDGLTVQRLVVSSKAVTYSKFPEIQNVKRYEVDIFSKLHEEGDEPVATLAVEPVVAKDERGRRALRYHITKPLVGSEWVTPGRETITVGEADVAFALSQQPGWDPRLHASIEAAMYKLPQGGDAVVSLDSGVDIQ